MYYRNTGDAHLDCRWLLIHQTISAELLGYFLNLSLSYMHVLLSPCVGAERRCGSGCGAVFDGIPYLQEHSFTVITSPTVNNYNHCDGITLNS